MTRAVGNSMRRVGRLLAFTGYYLWQLVVANAVVAWELLTPRLRIEPGIVALPLRSRRPRDVALLVGLITLTPGTLVLRISDLADLSQPPVLHVHGLHARDPEAFRRSLHDLEDRMLAALHGTQATGRAGAPSSGGRTS